MATRTDLRHHAARWRAVAGRVADVRRRSSSSPSSSNASAWTSSRPASRPLRRTTSRRSSRSPARSRAAIVAGLARGRRRRTSTAAGRRVKDAERRGFTPSSRRRTSTSKQQLRMTREQALELRRRDGRAGQVATARTSSSRRWTPRARTGTTCTRCIEAVIDAGATTINIADTVGYAHARRVRRADRRHLRARARTPTRPIISVHCHDDLGMAVANSLAAVRAGARQVECSINGIGERAGNASLEEIVMALTGRGRTSTRRRRPRSTRRRSARPARCWSQLHGHRGRSRTRRSSARTPSRTSPASTRTAC